MKYQILVIKYKVCLCNGRTFCISNIRSINKVPRCHGCMLRVVDSIQRCPECLGLLLAWGYIHICDWEKYLYPLNFFCLLLSVRVSDWSMIIKRERYLKPWHKKDNFQPQQLPHQVNVPFLCCLSTKERLSSIHTKTMWLCPIVQDGAAFPSLSTFMSKILPWLSSCQ